MVEINFRKFVRVPRVGSLPLVPSGGGGDGQRWQKQPTRLVLVGTKPRVWASRLLGHAPGWPLTGPHAWLAAGWVMRLVDWSRADQPRTWAGLHRGCFMQGGCATG